MSTEETQEQAPAAETTAEPKSSKKMLILAAVGAMIFGVGGGVMAIGPMLAKRNAPAVAGKDSAEVKEKKGEKGEKGHAGVLTTIENLVVNPAGTGGQRFLMFSVALESPDSLSATELKEHEPQVRDAIINAIGAKGVEELSDMARRDALKADLQKSLLAAFKEAKISRVYFPQFVIQ